MQIESFRSHVTARRWLEFEMSEAVFPGNQRGAVAKAAGLDETRSDVAEREADPPARRLVWTGGMGDHDVVKRHFASLELNIHGLRLVDLNKWSERGRPLVARVQMARGGIIVGRGTHIAARELRLNHRPLTEKITLAPEASVIDLPEWRFEVCSAGTHAVACGGATCGLLNVAPVGKAGNCRWCGRDFAGTGADTVLFDSPDALAWREA